jgi:hypothetical protein
MPWQHQLPGCEADLHHQRHLFHLTQAATLSFTSSAHWK